MDATITTTPTPTGRASTARAGAAPAASPESIAPELEAFAVPIGTLTQHPRNPRRGNLEPSPRASVASGSCDRYWFSGARASS